jgi:hypothetical protein
MRVIQWPFSWVFTRLAGDTANPVETLKALAGEAEDPGKSYPKVVAAILPIITVVNIWPLMVAVSMDPERTHYVAGHFEKVATDLYGAHFRQKCTLEDAIGSHACSL